MNLELFYQSEKSVILAHYTSIKKVSRKKDYYANKAAGQEQNFCIINSLLDTLWLSTEELFFWHFYGTSFKSIPGSLGTALLAAGQGQHKHFSKLGLNWEKNRAYLR